MASTEYLIDQPFRHKQDGWILLVTYLGLTYATITLFATVLILLVATHLNRWRLTKPYGVGLMFAYVLFLVMCSLYELNVFGMVHAPECPYIESPWYRTSTPFLRFPRTTDYLNGLVLLLLFTIPLFVRTCLPFCVLWCIVSMYHTVRYTWRHFCILYINIYSYAKNENWPLPFFTTMHHFQLATNSGHDYASAKANVLRKVFWW